MRDHRKKRPAEQTRLAWQLLLPAALSLLSACDRGAPGRLPPPRAPVDVVASRPVVGPGAVAFAATVRSLNQVEVATRLAGTVEAVAVNVGSVVSRGDVLVRIDARDVQARIQQAKAALENATRAFRRMEALAPDGAATDQELDNARAQYRIAKARLDEAQAQRAYTLLKAPMAGVVTARFVDTGDLVTPGSPALVMVEPGALKVVANLPGEYRDRVRKGDVVSILDPRTGRQRHATVLRTSPALEAATRRFRVEAALTPEGHALSLVPGAFVRLEAAAMEGGGAMWIPEDAIVRRGQLTAVFAVVHDTLRLRWVRPGEQRPGALEVLAGLDPAELVVRNPAPDLTDGLPVGTVRQVESGLPSTDSLPRGGHR